MAIRGPASSASTLERALAAATPWLGRLDDGVVPLVDVCAYGDRVVWVYPRTHTLAAELLKGPAEADLLPARAAAELVAQVASVLARLGAEHPGPEPADVLIGGSGDVRLIGFVGPFPPSPESRGPHGGVGAAAQVYRLGVLLARLLTGSAPAVGEDPAAHQNHLRRVLVRAMGRPGEPLPERYRDWLLGMLSWEPELRPALSAIPAGLTDAAREATGPGLKAWAEQHLSVRIAQVQSAPEWADESDLDEVPSQSSEESVIPGELTSGRTAPRIEKLDPFLADDDPTAESEAGSTAAALMGAPLEAGSIPVLVGPPPEAHRAKPRLSLPEVGASLSPSGRLPAGAARWLVLGLVVSAALTLVYALFLLAAMW